MTHLERAVDAINSAAVDAIFLQADLISSKKLFERLSTAVLQYAAAPHQLTDDYSQEEPLAARTLKAFAKVSTLLQADIPAEEYRKLGPSGPGFILDLAHNAWCGARNSYYAEGDSRRATGMAQSQQVFDAAVDAIKALDPRTADRVIADQAAAIVVGVYADVYTRPDLLGSRTAIVSHLLANQTVLPSELVVLAKGALQYAAQVVEKQARYEGMFINGEWNPNGVNRLEQWRDLAQSEINQALAAHGLENKALTPQAAENVAAKMLLLGEHYAGGSEGYGVFTATSMAFFGNRIPDPAVAGTLAYILQHSLNRPEAIAAGLGVVGSTPETYKPEQQPPPIAWPRPE